MNRSTAAKNGDRKSISSRIVSAAKEGRLWSGALRRLTQAPSPAREYWHRRALGQPQPPYGALPQVTLRGDFSSLRASVLLKRCIEQALVDSGGPPEFVRAIDGMSGQRYRTFISNFMGSQEDARYLEIGCWAGSTAAAALYGNSAGALCIDNWSQFGGPREAFFANMERVRPALSGLRFIEGDFRDVDYAALGHFNVFLFDGPHEESDQYAGIMIARAALADPVVLIVDDWNWRQVRLGTFRALRDAAYSIAACVEIRTTHDNTHAAVAGKNSDWHNGYFIAVLVRQ